MHIAHWKIVGSALATCLVTIVGCSGASSHHIAPKVPKSATEHVAMSECRKTPGEGQVLRGGYGLVFTKGSIFVTTPKNLGLPMTAYPRPGIESADPITNVHTQQGVATANSECLLFRKWGNVRPEVPPDSLLFTFRGKNGDGAQVSFLAVSMTGGVLPRIGDEHPRVGALVTTIPADIGISVDGNYFAANGCPLKIDKLNSHGVTGHFACPSAVPYEENPLYPNEDQKDILEGDLEPATHDQTTPIAPPAKAANGGIPIYGWFEVKP